MTPDLIQKLTHIGSLCHACLELDAKATPVPWLVEERFVWALTDSETGVARRDFKNGERQKVSSFSLSCQAYQKTSLAEVASNAAFIAKARDLCPRFARSTLTAISWIREDDPSSLPSVKRKAQDRAAEIASHFENI